MQGLGAEEGLDGGIVDMTAAAKSYEKNDSQDAATLHDEDDGNHNDDDYILLPTPFTSNMIINHTSISTRERSDRHNCGPCIKRSGGKAVK